MQVGFQKCASAGTCTCAVAVRSGDTVFVLNKCRSKRSSHRGHCKGKKKYQCADALQAKLYYHDNITDGTQIFKSTDGKGFEVRLKGYVRYIPIIRCNLSVSNTSVAALRL